MRIQNNIPAYNTHRNYNIANNAVAASTEKLSSGFRINRAGDDAAGLAISEKMRAQIRGLEMASKNSADGVSMVQTAEGALQETHNILQRMRELAVQSSSDANENTIDRAALNKEFQALKDEVDQIATATRFNDQNLIDGTFAKAIKFGSVSADAAGVGIVSAANKTKVGTYTLGVKQVTTGSVVAEAPTTFAANKGNATVGTGGVSIAKGSSLTADASLNGVWKLEYDSATSLFALRNQENGETRVAQAPVLTAGAGDVAINGNVVVDFGAGFGKVTIATSQAYGTKTATAAQAKDMNDQFGQLSSGVTVSIAGGADYSYGETKFYATMTGAGDAQIEVGDTSITFSNGVSLNLKNQLTHADLAVQTTPGADGLTHADDNAFNTDVALAAAYKGSITTVEKNNAALTLQTGANQGDELAINVEKMDASALGIANSSIASRKNASQAITQINNAVNAVSTQRAGLGALQNRLNHKIANLDVSAENLTAAESRIRDVDMAKEMSAFSKKNILTQAATAMLAQANQLPQNVLQLLR